MQIITKSGVKIEMPSDEEDEVITQHAIEDNTFENEESLNAFSVADDFLELQAAIRVEENPKIKTPISIRLSSEVVNYFRATGKGWQSRMNEVLQEYVSSQHV